MFKELGAYHQSGILTSHTPERGLFLQAEPASRSPTFYLPRLLGVREFDSLKPSELDHAGQEVT
jgi:hypothetical protein